MDIRMNKDDIIFAIKVYMAIKGFAVNGIIATMNKNDLEYITLKNVKPTHIDLKKLIETVKEYREEKAQWK